MEVSIGCFHIDLSIRHFLPSPFIHHDAEIAVGEVVSSVVLLSALGAGPG
jgi:hypothetical protein